MVQPYMASIEESGETTLVYLGGRLSHAVRREALLGAHGVRSPVTTAEVLSTVGSTAPSEAELTLSRAALGAVPGGNAALSYARVDLITGPDGPVLLELEVTDCFLFLGCAGPEAIIDGLARHVLGHPGAAHGV